jgi:hypothetical protein
VRAVKLDSPGIDTKCLPSYHSIFNLVEKMYRMAKRKKNTVMVGMGWLH